MKCKPKTVLFHVFIVVLKLTFSQLEDVWVVKDRITKLNKGIAYVKFSKASEAHIAMEQLHGATIGSDSKPIKVTDVDSCLKSVELFSYSSF